MHVAIHPEKSKTQDKVILHRTEQHHCPKIQGREELNPHVDLYEKCQALVGSQAKISPLAEDAKWTCVGD